MTAFRESALTSRLHMHKALNHRVNEFSPGVAYASLQNE